MHYIFNISDDQGEQVTARHRHRHDSQGQHASVCFSAAGSFRQIVFGVYVNHNYAVTYIRCYAVLHVPYSVTTAPCLRT